MLCSCTVIPCAPFLESHFKDQAHLNTTSELCARDDKMFGKELLFPNAQGFPFYSGVWGFRVCLLDVASTSAKVRNRPYEVRMAVPMGSSTRGVLFGGFRRVVASFRVAGVALCEIQTCFATCGKSFCLAGAILL